uniref:Uncharacterized protein n=1 Tax=Aegilops tauschii subsp. strangulata TaxID=200361 RepID=A0A452ZEC7_AEGTS
VAAAKSSGKKADEKVPSWARPGSDEPPPWARDEGGASGQEGDAAQVPFYAYLLASAVTAIAAVRFSSPSLSPPSSPPPPLRSADRRIRVQIGSIFEYTNGRAVFGVVGTDSPLYAPILGFFAVTGIPTSVRTLPRRIYASRLNLYCSC